MAYYNTCPVCGANLDPGEECECEKITVEIKKAPAKKSSCGRTLKVSTGADVKNDIKISISLYYENHKKSRGRRR